MPSTTAVLPAILSEIEGLFDIEDVPGVRRYLEEFGFLVPLLIDVNRGVRRYFPVESRLQLQLLADREVGDHVDLFVVIRTTLPEDNALRRLDQFDDEWWLAAAFQWRGRLTVDVESVA